MKDKFIKYFMKVAEESAALSYARRLQVGCVIVKDKRILSFGYNGTPSGWDNNCEDRIYANEWSIDNDIWNYQDETGRPYNLKTKEEVLHAEANALLKLAASTESSEGAILFITHAPCMGCAKLIYQARISHVIYKEEYKDSSGIDFLIKCGVGVDLYKDLLTPEE